MAKSKKQVETAAAEPVVEQTMTATLEPVVKVTAEQKKGKSSIENPVAVVWITSHNMCLAALAAGQSVPARKALVAASIAAGAAFYTARTQVQAYLKASANGTQIPSKPPRGVKFGA
jgi:hypothetical protein